MFLPLSVFRSVPVTALLLCSLLVALPAEGRPKTDSVTLDNGNLITGEIKLLSNGILSYSTDGMGTVRIEWDHVAAVNANFFFRIRTDDGQRFFGAIAPADEPGHLQIIHADGSKTFPIYKVVAIKPIESTLRDRLDTSLTFGFSDYKSSETRTTSFGLRMDYVDEYSINTLDARSVVNENDDETNSSNRVNLLRQRMREKNPRTFNYVGSTWETNDELALDYRFSLALGRGRHLLDSNRHQLSATLGVQALTEEDSLGENTESVEGLALISYSAWRYDTPELNLRTNLALFPGITESGRFRSVADITLEWEIVEDFNFNITAFGNYDNQSNEEGDDYDYGITTGIEWEL